MASDYPLKSDSATEAVPLCGFYDANSPPTEFLRFIAVMDEALGRIAINDFQPMQSDDVVATVADSQALHECVGFISQR